MKNYLRIAAYAVLFSFIGIKATNAQAVLLDSHSDAAGATTWQITTTQPNELIIIAADGYGAPILSEAAGTVTVNSNNATFITRGDWNGGSYGWSATIWAYPAATPGTYTLSCTESGLDNPYYFNYASAVYSTTGALSLADIIVGGHDSNQSQLLVATSISIPVSNSWVYGTTNWNDNPGSGTIKWTGGLTELDHDYLGYGVDCAQADSTYATAGTYTITVTDTGASSPWAVVALIAVRPPCAIAVSIDSAIHGGCNDSLWAVVSGGTGPYTYLWAPNGATTDTIGGLCSGSYTVTVTDSTGCSNSAIINTSPLGINALNKPTVRVNAYPNPFTQNFNVDISGNQPAIVTLFNMLGENVGTWTVNSGHSVINTEQYPSGIYLVQAKSLDGKMLLSKKLTKLAQ